MDYTQSRDYSPNFREAFWIWLGRGGTRAAVVVVTSNKHQQCGEMSQAITGQAMVARVRGTVKTRCPTTHGLRMLNPPSNTAGAKGRDEGPGVPTAVGSPSADCVLLPCRREKQTWQELFWARA